MFIYNNIYRVCNGLISQKNATTMNFIVVRYRGHLYGMDVLDCYTNLGPVSGITSSLVRYDNIHNHKLVAIESGAWLTFESLGKGGQKIKIGKIGLILKKIDQNFKGRN